MEEVWHDAFAEALRVSDLIEVDGSAAFLVASHVAAFVQFRHIAREATPSAALPYTEGFLEGPCCAAFLESLHIV